MRIQHTPVLRPGDERMYEHFSINRCCALHKQKKQTKKANKKRSTTNEYEL